MAKATEMVAFVSKKWRWKESNPRSNKELPDFLHAYSAIGFRAEQGSECIK